LSLVARVKLHLVMDQCDLASSISQLALLDKFAAGRLVGCGLAGSLLRVRHPVSATGASDNEIHKSGDSKDSIGRSRIPAGRHDR
jgi:hypothetical protein